MTTTQELVDENVKRLNEWNSSTVNTLTALTSTSADTIKVPVEALENVKLLLVAQANAMNALRDYINSLHEIAQTLTR